MDKKSLFATIIKTVIVLIFLGIISISTTQATAALLAEINASTTGTYGAGGVQDYELQGVFFTLGYGFNSFFGGTQPWGLNFDYQIGADVLWNNGSSGSYDFSPSNSNDFPQVANYLTDGIEQELLEGALILANPQEAMPTFIGSIGTGSDSYWTGLYPALNGASIDHISLVVDQVQFTLTQNGGYGIVDSNHIASWQAYGTPAPVPEPASMLLLGSGLAGLAVFRRKFRKR